jgi:hypothetical protein
MSGNLLPGFESIPVSGRILHAINVYQIGSSRGLAIKGMPLMPRGVLNSCQVSVDPLITVPIAIRDASDRARKLESENLKILTLRLYS